MPVSIRTRPESRVNLKMGVAFLPNAKVSIRTRPESRVNPASSSRACRSSVGFNPHPAREPGESATRHELVQSSPVSIRTRPESRVNQSSSFFSSSEKAIVSIRTRPESRVNRGDAAQRDIDLLVSIRTRPESRVNLPLVGVDRRGERGFNPHPAREPGESPERHACAAWEASFQSAPGPRAG